MGCGSSITEISATRTPFSNLSNERKQSRSLTPTIYYIPEDRIQLFQEMTELDNFHRGEETMLESNTNQKFKNIYDNIVQELENPKQSRTENTSK